MYHQTVLNTLQNFKMFHCAIFKPICSSQLSNDHLRDKKHALWPTRCFFILCDQTISTDQSIHSLWYNMYIVTLKDNVFYKHFRFKSQNKMTYSFNIMVSQLPTIDQIQYYIVFSWCFSRWLDQCRF